MLVRLSGKIAEAVESFRSHSREEGHLDSKEDMASEVLADKQVQPPLTDLTLAGY